VGEPLHGFFVRIKTGHSAVGEQIQDALLYTGDVPLMNRDADQGRRPTLGHGGGIVFRAWRRRVKASIGYNVPVADDQPAVNAVVILFDLLWVVALPKTCDAAARGPDGLLYPWGNEFIVDNVVRVRVRTRVPKVGSKPQGACWVGALDLSSSRFEWVSSLYQPYPYDAVDGREVRLDIDDSSDRVLRGSAWYDPDGMHDNVSATARFNAPLHWTAWYSGFRCARHFGLPSPLDPGELIGEPAGETSRTPAEQAPSGAQLGDTWTHPADGAVCGGEFTSAADCTAAGLPEIACTGVSTNDEWTPLIREFDGVPMALVPAGCFTMGSTEEQVDYAVEELVGRRLVYADEQPAHEQCFTEPFWIDVYEVTNEQYGSPGDRQAGDQPREMVSWFESGVHCESRGARLPTEAEWEYAARGPVEQSLRFGFRCARSFLPLRTVD
jgi:formylglycine-generating enzyme required for sulfatase activity